MAIQDAIKSFIAAHTSLIQELEQLGLSETINLLKSLYPQDAMLIAIAEKISAEVLKLQGITPPSQ